jgi:acetoin utilization protein AcuB
VELGRLIGMVTVTDVLEGEVRSAMGVSPASRPIAADVMTPLPLTVNAKTPLAEAVARMIDHRIRHLPVVDGSSTVVGMLSERDVRTLVGDFDSAAGRGRKGLGQTQVGDVMSKPAISVAFDCPLSDVARSFADHGIGAVPVVDKFGALVGIVSYIDALRTIGA